SAAWTLSTNLHGQFDGAVQVTPQLRTYTGPERKLDMVALWKMDSKTQVRLTVTDALHQDRIYTQQYLDQTRSSRMSARTLLRVAMEMKL
ncbi:MAG TPA: TonB-dependent receptor, partial [Telluria sp.]